MGKLSAGIEETTPVLGKALPVLKRVPYVGAGIALAGIGTDIAMGKDPGKAAFSGVSSFAAGAAVGAMIGGPVGVVAGGLVGMGVGYVVDEWGYDAVTGAAGQAWDKAEDAAGWVGDKAGDIAKGIGGLFD